MRIHLKILLIAIGMLLISCNNTDKSLLEIIPKDLNSLKNILKYLAIIYIQMALIRVVLYLIFGVKLNINLILFLLFLYIYFSNQFGFFRLFVITFLPNIFYLIYLYLKKLYSAK